MVLSKDDMVAKLSAYIGEDNSDESISLLEDVADTFDSISKNETEDWKAKYEENDTMWRNKYKERFMNGKEEDKDVTVVEESKEEVSDEVTDFDDLFKGE